jgi:hypothetical protein
MSQPSAFMGSPMLMGSQSELSPLLTHISRRHNDLNMAALNGTWQSLVPLPQDDEYEDESEDDSGDERSDDDDDDSGEWVSESDEERILNGGGGFIQSRKATVVPWS